MPRTSEVQAVFHLNIRSSDAPRLFDRLSICLRLYGGKTESAAMDHEAGEAVLSKEVPHDLVLPVSAPFWPFNSYAPPIGHDVLRQDFEVVPEHHGGADVVLNLFPHPCKG